MILKKLFVALLIVVPFVFVACNSENEYHRVVFIPNSNQSAQLIFADQTTDTLLLCSTDPWVASQMGEWFTLEKTGENFQAGTEYIFKIPLTVQPNLTGKVREGMVSVKASREVMLSIIQMPWLNIISPVAQIELDDRQNTVAKFVQYVKGTAGSSTLQFTTYKEGATLRAQDAWITVPDTLLPVGYHEIKISTALNPQKSEHTEASR